MDTNRDLQILAQQDNLQLQDRENEVIQALMALDPIIADGFRRDLHQYINDENLRMAGHRERIAHVIWVFGFLPLPVVNYGLLWRRNRPRSFWHAISATVLSAISICVKCLRWLLYFLTIGHYVWGVIKSSLMFACAATFSDNSLWDLYTYAMRGFPLLLHRHTMMYGGEALRTDSVSNFIVDNLANKLRTTCMSIHLANETIRTCSLHNETLIYRFSEAFEKTSTVQKFPPWVVTILTVFTYTLYVTLAQVLGFNIVLFYLLQTGYRMQNPLTILTRLVVSGWKGLQEYVL